MNNVSILSIDLAKNVFQLLGIDEHGKPCFSKRVSRVKLHEIILNLPPCEVVMEACSSSHYWGRACLNSGHQVNLIPAQHVTPFVRGNKNDKNDCLAIYEASRRPSIRFVPVKSEQQQAVLCLHRIRERLLGTRTACINQTRSLLLEFGFHIPKAYSVFKKHIHELLSQDVQPVIRLMLLEVQQELESYDKKLNSWILCFNKLTPTTPVQKLCNQFQGLALSLPPRSAPASIKAKHLKVRKTLASGLALRLGNMRLVKQIVWALLLNVEINTSESNLFMVLELL